MFTALEFWEANVFHCSSYPVVIQKNSQLDSVLRPHFGGGTPDLQDIAPRANGIEFSLQLLPVSNWRQVEYYWEGKLEERMPQKIGKFYLGKAVHFSDGGLELKAAFSVARGSSLAALQETASQICRQMNEPPSAKQRFVNHLNGLKHNSKS